MATAKKKGLPEDWQSQVTHALHKMKEDDPTRNVFGLSLPESWKGELTTYVRNGDLRRMFLVKAISFSGSDISRLDPPETKEDKKAS